LPTSLTRVLLCTRGCSPWKPDAVWSTHAGWVKLTAGLFMGRGKGSRAARDGPPLPRWEEASLLNGFPLRPFKSASKRKEGSSEASPRRGPVTWRRRTHPQPRFRNFNRIPFRGTPSFFPVKGSRGALLAFASPLGATHSRPIAVHAKPFSTPVHKGFTRVVATSTKICTRAPSNPSRDEPSTVSPTLSYSPLLPWLEGWGRMRGPLERHPFSGPQNSAGGL